MKKVFQYLSIILVLVITTSMTANKVSTKNNLGYGLKIGGVYQEDELLIHQSEWCQYTSTAKVKSGWLYRESAGEGHANAYFKV